MKRDDSKLDTTEERQRLQPLRRYLNAHSTGVWRHSRLLEKSPDDCVRIWVCTDREGLVLDRMVVKTCHNPASAQLFQCEADIHRYLDRLGCKYIAPLRKILSNYLFEDEARIICTEFAEQGSLQDLIDRHNHSEDRSPIPEPFLWYLLHALVHACITLQYGTLNLTAPLEGLVGREIVHNDIKPANILLYNPSAVVDGISGKVYPVPCLADFGDSRIAGSFGSNEDDWGGTLGFLVPESRMLQDRAPALQEVLDLHFHYSEKGMRAHSNVFQLGVVLYCCMTLLKQPAECGGSIKHLNIMQSESEGSDQRSSNNISWLRLEHIPQTEGPLEGREDQFDAYSDHLRVIVMRMLAIHPSDRPDLIHLSKTISKTVQCSSLMTLYQSESAGSDGLIPDALDGLCDFEEDFQEQVYQNYLWKNPRSTSAREIRSPVLKRRKSCYADVERRLNKFWSCRLALQESSRRQGSTSDTGNTVVDSTFRTAPKVFDGCDLCNTTKPKGSGRKRQYEDAFGVPQTICS